MNKFFLSAIAVVVMCGSAKAEGYQINSLSAKQLGMGHTGIALKLGAENMYFNPAGLAFMKETFDISGSIIGTMPTVTATIDGKKYETDNGVSTPLGIHAAFSIYDNLKAGVSFFTPYGSAINWTENWPGAVLTQNVKLQIFAIQPTVSWAITPRFSIGAGAMISWASVDLNKGLVTASTMDKVLAMQGVDFSFGQTSPASVNLNGKSEIVAGLNVGAMFDVNDKITVGASFRTKMALKVNAGDATVRYANDIAQGALGSTLDLINNANFKAEMPAPWVLGLGVSYKPIDRLTLAFDARLTGWNAYKALNIDFLAEQLTSFNQHITKNYKNSWCYSVGGQFALTDRFDARLGIMIDTTPVNDKYYNPETPGMTKIEPTVGFSFRPTPSVSIDLAFMYVAGLGADNVSCEYSDLLGKQVLAQNPAASALGFSSTGTINADYKLRALSPAIGISYRF